MRKLPSTTRTNSVGQFLLKRVLPPVVAVALFLGIWQVLASSGIVPSFMMPSPLATASAFINDWGVLWYHGIVTLEEAFLGLAIGVVLGYAVAVLMDAIPIVRNALYPIVVASQTIPSVAIAPMLLLWFGVGIMPKVVLIVITTFFPITVSVIDGFASVDQDAMNLMRSMGAGPIMRFVHIKMPNSLGYFFSGLKISVSYSVVGAVISEWIGGTRGLGVYLARTRKSFLYDHMFAVIFFIALVSLLLMALVSLLRYGVMPWERKSKQR